MARDLNGSTQYLQGTFTPVTAYPFSLACWIFPDSATANQFVFGLSDVSASNVFYGLQLRGHLANDYVGAMSYSVNPPGVALTTSGYSTTAWHHICGTYTSDASRAVYLDGGSKGTNTTSVSFNGSVDTTQIGRWSRSSPMFYTDGDIAEAAIWDVALTDAEVASLANGASPLSIRPQNLVAYWPIVGKHSPEIDIVGGNNLTVTGATASSHPRIFRPPQKIWVPYSAAGEAYSLTCDPGSYTLTGTAATLQHDKAIAADPGSYLWTGTSAGLQYGRSLSADPDSYAWTGTAATLQHDKALAAESAVYLWTGTAADLEYGRSLSADPGSYVWTGTAADLEYGRSLSADPGSYTWTGTAAALQHDRILSAESGAYTWTGTASDLGYGRVLPAEAGSYSWAGTAASLEHDKILSADAGAFTWTGTDATLTHSAVGAYTLVADGGSYTWTGTAAAVQHDKVISAEASSYLWTGTAATLAKEYTLSAAGTSYSITGTAADFWHDRVISAGAGEYALAGTEATLSYSGVPPVPYDISYKGGGRVLRKGSLPEWWEEWEEPQPEEAPDAAEIAKEQLAELAGELPLPIEEKRETADVIPIRKQISYALQAETGIYALTGTDGELSYNNDDVTKLKSQVAILNRDMRSMRRKLAASLLLSLRK